MWFKLMLLRDKIRKLEDAQLSMQQSISSTHTSLSTADSHYRSLIVQMDDLENRNRRNNVRLRGVPDSVRAQDLTSTLTNFFNSLIGRDRDTFIELDRAHRALTQLVPETLFAVYTFILLKKPSCARHARLLICPFRDPRSPYFLTSQDARCSFVPPLNRSWRYSRPEISPTSGVSPSLSMSNIRMSLPHSDVLRISQPSSSH